MNKQLQEASKLRVLVLVEKPPFPLSNGVNLRIYYLCKYLRDRCDLHLLCCDIFDIPNDLYEVFSEILALPTRSHVSDSSRAFRISKKFSSSALFEENRDASEYLQTVLKNYDLVVSTTQLLPYIDFPRKTPIVVDIIDDAVLQQWREIAVTNGFWAKVRKIYYMYLQFLFERRYCSQSYINAAFITSEVDLSTFRMVSNLQSVRVIQNGVDSEYFRPMGELEDNDLIVFEGNMSFDQNVIGARYFCDRIFPLILKERPQAEIVLVGRDPVQEILDLANRAGVTVTGSVDDIRPYISSAAVFVCPLLSGGGIKNKILQAWSMSKACVATTRSVGGLAVEHEKNIIVRDDATEFAKAVIELMGEAERRRKIGQNARDTILANYSWEKKADELYDLIRSQLD